MLLDAVNDAVVIQATEEGIARCPAFCSLRAVRGLEGAVGGGFGTCVRSCAYREDTHGETIWESDRVRVIFRRYILDDLCSGDSVRHQWIAISVHFRGALTRYR